MNALFGEMESKDVDFRVAAFPCNQFGLQEPGADYREIINGLKYVRPGYGYIPDRRIHLFNKIDVNGKSENEMFTFLKHTCPPAHDVIGKRGELFWDPIKVSDIRWNFEKFLIDQDGKPRFRFVPKVDPSQLGPFIKSIA